MKMMSRLTAFVLCIMLVLFDINTSAFTEAASTPEESFDSAAGVYRETFADGRQFTSSVPNGGQVYDGVVLDVPADISAVLMYNGKATSFKNNQPIYGNGYYVLRLNATSVITGEACAEVFTFRIAGNASGGSYSSRFGCRYIACIASITDGERLNRFTFPNYKAFYSSLNSYGETVDQAVFSIPVNLGYELLRNGSRVSITDNTPITQSGDYSLYVYAKNYGATDEYEAVYGTVLTFTVEDKTPEENAVAERNTLQQTERAIQYETFTEATTESVKEDSLSELYNEQALLYKESFSNGDGFYTNTANGSLVGGNVYIDFPSNMDVVMYKDGLQAGFENKAYINEQGTYVFNITDNFQNEHCTARYSFRIQNGVEKAADAAESVASEAENGDFDQTETEETHESGSVSLQYDEDYTYNQDRGMFEYSIGTEKFYTNMPPGMFSNEGLIIDVPSTLTWTVKKDGEDFEPNSRINESGTYDIEIRDLSGNLMTLGFYLYDNPINFLSEYAVPKNYSVISLKYEDYKGIYTSSEQTTETTTEASHKDDNKIALDENEETTTEEITEQSSVDEEAAALAEKGKRGKKSIDSQSQKALEGGLSTVAMPLDGKYTLLMSGDDMPELSAVITVDTTAPVVIIDGLNEKMRSTGNSVTASCDDDEVTMLLYGDNGNETVLTEQGGSVLIEGFGDFTLTAVDKAGNSSEYQFKIVRHIGVAGIGAIVLLVVLLAGLVAFIVYNTRKLSVR